MSTLLSHTFEAFGTFATDKSGSHLCYCVCGDQEQCKRGTYTTGQTLTCNYLFVFFTSRGGEMEQTTYRRFNEVPALAVVCTYHGWKMHVCMYGALFVLFLVFCK